MKSGNMTSNSTFPNKNVNTPPNKLFREYLRCRQLSSLNSLPSPYACPYDYEDDIRVCWRATMNGTIARSNIEYDHGQNNFYDGVRYGIENCTLERLCLSNGTWDMTLSPDIQCKTCIGDGRPVKFNSISIMIETMSLSLSLLSLTIAVLCMMNVKYVSYFYVKVFRLKLSDLNQRPPHQFFQQPKYHFIVIPRHTPLLCKYFLLFRRLHLPRNLLHMHLFVAFIFRSIVKIVFIHLIVGGYTRSMISYTQDKCGNIEILSKSSSLFHINGCRVLSSLFWYTDAVSQTFIFCEAMFLFTALTSHLFRDRGCLPFVLWGWLSPLVWLAMWIASHLLTDRVKERSTCWLEADNTTYFYYFFYVPYAFYLLVNFGIFLYLVRLLYSKYQSNNIQTNRTGNRHLIKSILILIPLFGLHSLFVIWVFYHKNQGHTIWYYMTVIFKAVFGDLQGFFTSLIYFYFNTEIRYEVLRQVQRTILNNDPIQRSSTGETLSTRLSTFRRSINRHRQSSLQTRQQERRRTTKPSHNIWKKKSLTFLCPCFHRNFPTKKIISEQAPLHQQQTMEPNHLNDTLPAVVPDLIIDDDLGGLSSPLVRIKNNIENDYMTCDTMLMKNDHELSTDENEVTIHRTSVSIETKSNIQLNTLQRMRSNSEGNLDKNSSLKSSSDNKSLK
ncbi:hypothetical protein I4U23_025173 [Adineta vaga]|nr:hypothetical protein I4U23_025173 [Adineta vaga]